MEGVSFLVKNDCAKHASQSRTRRIPFRFCGALSGLLIGMIFLTACAHQSPRQVQKGDVAMRVILPPGSSKYQMRADQTFVMAEFEGLPPSLTYPEQLLDKGLPEQIVCVDVSVNENGAVYSATPLLIQRTAQLHLNRQTPHLRMQQ